MEQYKAKKGYLPLVADDVTRPATFQALAADRYDLGQVKKRHGTVLGITEREFAALQARERQLTDARQRGVQPGATLK